MDGDRLTRESWLALGAAYACILGTTVALGLTLPLLPVAIERAGYSTAFNGFNAATGAAGLVLFSPFLPKMAHRFGITGVLWMSFAVASACLALFPFTPIWAWFPLRFALNVSLVGLYVVSEVWINSIATARTRGRLIGLYGVLATAGFAIGPLVASQFNDFTPPFLLGAAIVLLGVGPVLAARHLAPSVENTSMAGIVSVAGLAVIPILAAFVHATSEVALSSLAPVFAVRSGWQADDAILLITAFGLGNVLLQIPLGWLADVWSRRSVLLACALLGSACALVLPLTPGMPWLLATVMFLAGGFIIGIYTIGLTLIGEEFAGPRLAPASAGFSFAYSVGSILGPGGAGLSMDGFGPAGLGWFVAFACGAYALILLCNPRP